MLLTALAYRRTNFRGWARFNSFVLLSPDGADAKLRALVEFFWIRSFSFKLSACGRSPSVVLESGQLRLSYGRDLPLPYFLDFLYFFSA